MGRRPFVRQRILEAAFDRIARRGYEAVSTREIAATAKVGHASMYRHYPSKEALGRELYQVALQPIAEEFAELERRAPAAEVAVGAVVEILYGLYDQRPRALALLIFPPHDFTPRELEAGNDESVRARFRRLIGCDEDEAAIIWGAICGPLHDRYLHRRRGRMGPLAAPHAARIQQLLEGKESRR